MKRASLVVGAAVCFAIAIGAVTAVRQRRSNARADLVRVAEQIKLGDLEKNTLDVITARFSDAHMIAVNADHICRVATPLEFGATNWVLYVLFKDQEVVGVGFRRDDNPHRRPRDAPHDRVERASRAKWSARFGGEKGVRNQ